MVYDSLEALKNYADVIPNFDKVAEFLSRDLSALPDGRVELDGDNLYASLNTYNTKPIENCLFESHDRYIDIQILLSGEEICGVSPSSERLEVATPYDTAKDYRLLQVPDWPCAMLPLHPGVFAIFWHDDAHMPGVAIDEKPSSVRKCVIKIRL